MSIPTARRKAWAFTGGFVLTLTAAACAVDNQTESSNRDVGTDSGNTRVENAFIVPKFAPGSCAIQVGDTAELKFTAVNNRHTDAERLIGISTPAANAVVIAPGPSIQIAPGTSIAVGQPIQQPTTPAPPQQPFTVTLQGTTDAVKPATSVNVTFRFDKSGNLDIQVPIEACPTQPT